MGYSTRNGWNILSDGLNKSIQHVSYIGPDYQLAIGIQLIMGSDGLNKSTVEALKTDTTRDRPKCPS